MLKVILILFILLFSLSTFASCSSKIKLRVKRKLDLQGLDSQINFIKVTHQEHFEINQGTFIKEMDRFEIEVHAAGQDATRFSGLTATQGSGCRVEAITELKPLFL